MANGYTPNWNLKKTGDLKTVKTKIAQTFLALNTLGMK